MAAIKRKKLGDAVLEEIKRMITDGELAEGDKLPNQNEFSAQLGVSRPSLREALHTLNLMGVIEQRPGLGTVIKSANPALWMEQFIREAFTVIPGLLEKSLGFHVNIYEGVKKRMCARLLPACVNTFKISTHPSKGFIHAPIRQGHSDHIR